MIQPGQIDYQEQLDSLRDLPVNADSIEYLTGLSRDPSSPFVRFLVESRLEQLTKALQNQAGSQAQQAQENSPQGTISDKIQQAAGLAALQSAQQRQAAQQMQQQASQPRMPVPEGITQPQAQAEADYGVASAPVDSEMFNFAPGGIVTFANPEKEKKQLVKDEEDERLRKQTEMYVAAAQEAAKQRAIDAANAPPKEVSTEDPAMGMSGGPAKVNPLSRMLLDPLKAAASGISSLVSRPTPQTMMLDKGEAPTLAPMAAPMAGPAADTESQKLARLAANPPAAQNMNPALQPNRNVPPPPAPPSTNVKPPAPPAPPPAAPNATAGIETLINKMYNMPERNQFGKLIEEARANMVTTPQSKLIEDELELQKTLGIGTFAKQQQQMYEDNKARQAKIEAGRGQRDFMAQLAAYSRPGANWSQVVERDIANKSAALMEDERFANAQNKLLTDIQATAEAQRVGTASTVRTAKAKEKETREKMLDLIMRLTGEDAKIAQAILGDTLKTAVSLYGYDVQSRGQDMQYKVGMANASNRNELAAVKLDLAQARLDQTIKQAGVDNRLKLSNSKPYVDLDKQINGVETRIRYETNPDGTPKDPEKMGKLTTDLANLKTRQADLASQILGTGGISTLPASAPPPGAVREVKKP
jgi:hypothetical protein